MLALLSLAAALAQSVNVNVMPLRDVLPPQVMYYLSNPGQYFNITVQNPSTEAQQIFFGAELRQVTPASGLEVVVLGQDHAAPAYRGWCGCHARSHRSGDADDVQPRPILGRLDAVQSVLRCHLWFLRQPA